MVRPINSILIKIRLNYVLRSYLDRVEMHARLIHQDVTVKLVKSFNIIVITDGVPLDNVELVIIHAAKKFDVCEAES
jgi:hypothetical protein